MRLRRSNPEPEAELLPGPERALGLHLRHAHASARNAHERRRGRGTERGRKCLRLLGLLRVLQRILLLIEGLLRLLELKRLHLLELSLRGVCTWHALQLHGPLLLRRRLH